MHNKYRLLSLVFSILICSACDSTVNHNTQNAAPNPSAKTVFVLFDISNSTNAQETRKKYLESFGKIVGKIGGGDVLVADFISDDPLGQSSFTINTEFPVFQTNTDNDLLVRKQKQDFEKKIEDLRKQEQDKAAQMLGDTNRSVKKTKILDANLLAEKVFKKFDRQKKILVLFSDMIESSEKMDFQKQQFTTEAIKKIIENEKKAGRIPNLAGVRVYVVGAAGGNTSDSFNQIQNFWLEYFKAAGADLSKENYGAALLKFNE